MLGNDFRVFSGDLRLGTTAKPEHAQMLANVRKSMSIFILMLATKANSIYKWRYSENEL